MKIKYIVALMTVIATAGGCTQDTGEQPEEAVPIRLAATITPTDVGKTRAFGVWGGAATTQDTELLTGQTVRAWISENDGSHTDPIKDPIEYTVSNAAGDLEPVNTTTDPAFYYPQGVDVISIHAIHPSGYASGDKFTVNLDQTTEANYAASDLCYSMPTNFSRTDVDANGRKLLQMKHLLSKIVVNLTLDANVTGATLPTSIKLHANTSTTMTYPVAVTTDANGYTGCTPSDASDPGVITMKQEAIIPPQTIAAGASFISFSVTGLGPMIYPMPDATTFESGKRYTYNIRVKNVGIAVTTDVTDWGAKVPNQQVMGKFNWEIRKNPLWYVAEYNILDAAGTEMASTENAGYFFTWTDAMNRFTGGTTSISEYTRGNNTIANTPSGSTWHLPVRGEWWSIVPSGLTNLASIKSYSGLTTVNNAPVVFGYNNTTKRGIIETSWWTTLSQTETRAIRFLGTEFCSAWKYVWANNILTISATLIEPVEKNATAASTWYNSHNWNGTGENAIFWGNDDEKLAVQRSFYSRGHGVDSSGPTGSVQVNLHVLHWSATEISDDYSTDNDAWRLQCVVNNYYSVSYGGGSNGKNHLSFCIRLFRDN